MERKEILEKLNLANDINQLELKELANKYLCNEDTYSKFISDYSNMFVSSPLYQLRVSSEYKKIAELVDAGAAMYPSEENDNKVCKLLYEIEYNINAYNLKSKSDDEFQAKYLLYTHIGEIKSKMRDNYKTIVLGMNNAALKYENSNYSTIDDFKNYMELYKYANKEDVERAYKHYSINHPMMDVCNNIYFLYYVNYLFYCNPSLVDDDLIKDVENVIAASKVIEQSHLNKNHETFKNYLKVAKFTEKNIKEYKNVNVKKLRKM